MDAARTLGLLIVPVLAGTALAHPEGDPLSRWYRWLNTAIGVSCCSEHDCKPVEARLVGDEWQIRGENRWEPVPSQAVLQARKPRRSPDRLPLSRLDSLLHTARRQLSLVSKEKPRRSGAESHNTGSVGEWLAGFNRRAARRFPPPCRRVHHDLIHEHRRHEQRELPFHKGEREIARTLSLVLLEDVGRRIEIEKSAHLSTPDLLMRAQALLCRPYSPGILQTAQNVYELAIEKDPDSIDAKIGVASSLLFRIRAGWCSPDQNILCRAEKLLLDANDYNGNSSLARTTMGILRRLQDRLSESLIELEAARDLDIKNIDAIRQFGYTVMDQGQPEAAIIHIEKGIRSFPFDAHAPGTLLVLGLCHFIMGDNEKAIDLSLRSLAGNRWLYPHSRAPGCNFCA
jgi:hypothetical protein